MLSECIRVRFKKIGRLKYISHLDLQRTFGTGLIRSGLPIWYSKGFNPHPKLVFALTVSVGSESEYELLDIRLDQPVDASVALEKLKSSFTKDMEILDVYEPVHKFSEIMWSEYEIALRDPVSQEQAEAFLEGEIVTTRRTKSGDKCEDIRPMIHSIKVNDKGFDVILRAGQELYLNPEYMMRALESFIGKPFEEYSIKRIDMLDASLSHFE